MNLNPLKTDNTRNNVAFKAKITTVDDLRAAKRFANCALGGLEDSLINSIKKTQPNLIKDMDGAEYIPNDTLIRRAVSSLKSFFGMPLDILDSIAKKFPNSGLNNLKFLQKYRESVELENQIRALQGIQENSFNYARKFMDENGLTDYPTGVCDSYCARICDSVTNEFNKGLNDAMADNVANYDTKKERFATRLVSGFTAALFLGSDFYNKSIQKGKTVEEAKKEQHLKQGQEIKENICEAITQFAVFACFSKTVNKSVWAPAIIGAAIGLVSRVISRLSSGMKITRVKVQNNNNSAIPSFKEYAESAKDKTTQDLLSKKHKEQIEKAKKENKKPILSPKNLLLFCLFSIAGGYSLRFLKGHTKIGQDIAQAIQKHVDKFNSEVTEASFAQASKLTKISNILDANGNRKFANDIEDMVSKHANEDGKVLLGRIYKTKKIFGIEVKTKDLKALKTAPFRFIKELVSYPYKIAVKLEDAIKKSILEAMRKAEKNERLSKSEEAIVNWIKKNNIKIQISEKATPTEDIYNIQNLYSRFVEFEAKYGDDEAKLSEEFSKYINQMFMLSNNKVTSSKGDNSKIAVIAQTLGTLTGMWFNMNDEFNASIRNGSTNAEAKKDARLRGINKFFRMTVQIIISGSLNSIFCRQYNSSIAKSALVVAASTVLTDMASRVLSGMPFKKMNKAELEKYQKDHKEGSMAWYYKLIDKLAS